MRELPAALTRRPPVDLADKILLNMQDLTELLDVSEPTVRQLVKAGLPTVRIGIRVLFRRQSVEAWLASRETSETEGSQRSSIDHQ